MKGKKQDDDTDKENIGFFILVHDLFLVCGLRNYCNTSATFCKWIWASFYPHIEELFDSA